MAYFFFPKNFVVQIFGKGKDMERIAVHFGWCGKERESFPILTGRNGKEMLSKKNGQGNMYEKSKLYVLF